MDEAPLHEDGTVPTTPAKGANGRVVVGFAVWEVPGDPEDNKLMSEWRQEGYDASGGNSGRNISHAISAFAESYLIKAERQCVRLFLNTICDHGTLAHLQAILHHNFSSLSAMLHLQFLTTHPSLQRSGAGGLLLEWLSLIHI